MQSTNRNRNRTALLGAAIFALMASAAHAGPIVGGDTTNNQGGAGGGGGTGVGVGIAGAAAGAAAGASANVGDIRNTNTAAGGSVLGSGNSSNDIRNTNTANGGNATQGQGQLQGQQQGQGQSQSSANRNDNRSNASNANSNAAQGNTTSTSVSVAGDNVTYQAARIPVATAYASGLTASNGTCMGSSSMGGQGMSFGFSLGSTWKDAGCDRRYNAQALAAVGQAKAAVALLCQDSDIAAAMELAGTPCAKANVATVKPTAVAQADTAGSNAGYNGTDPIIRARLGLPPLK